MKLILASASPRRRELLTQAGYTFSVHTLPVEETLSPALSPAENVMALAKQKATAVSLQFPHCLVVGADTVVSLEGRILGKPSCEEDAFAMLQSLSGRTHTVYTGVCLSHLEKGIARTFFQQTDVTFYPLSEEEIRRYIATGEPMDKAGSYGIQGRGCLFVKEISGDYCNVVGFPLAKFERELRQLP